MSDKSQCRQIRDLRMNARESLPPRVREHLESCSDCRSEARLDEWIGRAIGSMPVAQADVSAAVMARIQAEPSRLAMALQGVALGILVLCLGTLVSTSWPIVDGFDPSFDPSFAHGISESGVKLIQQAVALAGHAVLPITDAPGPPMVVLILVLAVLVALNLHVALRPASARRET